MGLVGDIAKAILIITVVYWLYAIIEFAIMGQYVLSLFIFLGFLISLSIIAYERKKSGKKTEAKS
jgi:hypothetical protein